MKQIERDATVQIIAIFISAMVAKMRYLSLVLPTLMVGVILVMGCRSSHAPVYPPTEAIDSFVLADSNLEVQLVAGEPLVQDPVAMVFDASGRLWVVEMLGFMPDIDGLGEDIANGRVAVLIDEDGDGEMDLKKIFIDSLHLPRAIAIVEDGILIAEQMPLWLATDKDGDLRADEKILVDSNYGGLPLPEHSANGLWRGLDGWFYNAKSKSRYKKRNDKWIEEDTEFRGQWGICHDNEGRLYYNYNWSQLHADLVPPNYMGRNPNHQYAAGIDHGLTLRRKVFPIRSNPAVNRGYVPGTLDADGKLLEFASACAPFIYRGDLLPNEYHGNAFVCEPTANLIVRNLVMEQGISVSAQPAYLDRDFLTSYDERFRPIFMSDGPDGALYFVDMYRGIIQHGPYMSKYLREVTLRRGLDKHIHLGRIWKIVPKNAKPKSLIDLTLLNDSMLVEQLESDNGWIRDKTQYLLTNKSSQAIILKVKEKALQGRNPLARLHARWILSEWDKLHQCPISDLLGEKDPVILATTVRLLFNATISKQARSYLQEWISDNFTGVHPKVKLQIVLHSDRMMEDQALWVAKHYLESFNADPVARDAVMSGLYSREYRLLQRLMADPHNWGSQTQHREIVFETLATAIINQGLTKSLQGLLDNMTQLPSWQQNALLLGLSNHSRSIDSLIVLSEKPTLLLSSALLDIDTARILDVISWPGKAKRIRPKESSSTQREMVNRHARNKYINLCASCHGMQGEGMARFAPPLRESEWVIGDPDKLLMILLHGMQGPIEVNGKHYGPPDIMPAMPSFSTSQNADLADIATYIRTSWGHSANPIKSSRVSHIRYRTQGKLTPWRAQELKEFAFDEDL